MPPVHFVRQLPVLAWMRTCSLPLCPKLKPSCSWAIESQAMGVQCLLPGKQLLAADSTVHFQAGDGIVSRETEPVDTGSVQPGAACVRPGSDNTPSCAISSTEHWGGPGQQCLRLPHTGHVPTRAAGAVYKTYSAQQKPVAARVQTKVSGPARPEDKIRTAPADPVLLSGRRGHHAALSVWRECIPSFIVRS